LLATFGRIRRTLAGRGGHSKWRNHHGCEQSHEREFFHDEILLDIPTAGKLRLHDRRNTSLAAIPTCFNRRADVAAAEPGRDLHAPAYPCTKVRRTSHGMDPLRARRGVNFSFGAAAPFCGRANSVPAMCSPSLR